MKPLLAILLTLALGTCWAAQPVAAPPLQGEVLETTDAGPYTYLHLKTKDGQIWAAVMKAPVKKGARVTIQDPMTMTNFKSQTLGKTFDTIIFGTLAGAPGSTAASAAPAAAPMPPHPATTSAADVPVGKVAKAAGTDARTVAEVLRDFL